MSLLLTGVNPNDSAASSTQGEPGSTEGSAMFANLLARKLEIPSVDASQRSSGSEGRKETRNIGTRDEPQARTMKDTSPPGQGVPAEKPDAGEPSSQTLAESGPPGLSGTWTAWGMAATSLDLAGLIPNSLPDQTGMEVIPVEVRARLAADIAAGFTERGGVQTLSLKLEPGHLGKVEVRLQATGEHLSVRITAASKEAEAALRENIRDLGDAIQEKTGRFQTVDVRVNLKADGDSGRRGSADETSGQSGEKSSGEDTERTGQDHENRDPEDGPGFMKAETEPAGRAQEG